MRKGGVPATTENSLEPERSANEVSRAARGVGGGAPAPLRTDAHRH